VITLLYLSKQIRQNSRSVQVAVLRDTTSQWNHWSELLAMSPDLAEIVARGNHSFKSLAEVDALRYGAEFVDWINTQRGKGGTSG